MEAREEILTRLRVALPDRVDGPAEPPVPRDYRRDLDAGAAELVELLAERLLDYRAAVHRCPAGGIPDTVRTVLSNRGSRTLVVPPGLPAAWYAGFDGEVRADSPAAPLPVAVLDHTDTVLTGCAVAIAETGTLVLDAGRAQGRRCLTLVPDHHICVVRPDQITALLPAALARLTGTRPLTFISGPSATSDIELNRVEGVHGPRHLDVILAG